jgi:UDP-perosamine 4-acetyltransferase
MKRPIIIIGAGGHAKVVADALLAAHEPVEGFTDAESSRRGAMILGIPILGGDDVVLARGVQSVRLANGIGSVESTARRREVFMHFRELGFRFVTVVHPRATVSPSAVLAEGVQVMAGAVIQAGAVAGENAIVNTSAIVDHDCRIGAHCHLAPGCVLSGGITIGDGSHIGAGSTVRQGLNLGPNTVVAAGAAVVSDHVGGATLAGVPARLLT